MHRACAGCRRAAGCGGMAGALAVGEPVGAALEGLEQCAGLRIPAVDPVAGQVEGEQRSVGRDVQEAVRVRGRREGTLRGDLVQEVQRLAIRSQDVEGETGVGGEGLFAGTAGHEVVQRHRTAGEHGHVESVADQARHRHRANHLEIRVQLGHPPSLVVEDVEFFAVLPYPGHMRVLAWALTLTPDAAEVRTVGREDGEFGPGGDVLKGHREAAVGEALDVPRQPDHRFAVGSEEDVGGDLDRA